MKQRNFRMNDSVYTMLKQMAEYEEVSLSDMLRLCIQSVYTSYRDDDKDTFDVYTFDDSVYTTQTKYDFSYVE